MTNPYDDYLAFERMMKPIRDYERMMQPIRDYERMMQPVRDHERMMQSVRDFDRLMQPIQDAERLLQPLREAERLMQPMRDAERLLKTVRDATELQAWRDADSYLQYTRIAEEVANQRRLASDASQMRAQLEARADWERMRKQQELLSATFREVQRFGEQSVQQVRQLVEQTQAATIFDRGTWAALGDLRSVFDADALARIERELAEIPEDSQERLREAIVAAIVRGFRKARKPIDWLTVIGLAFAVLTYVEGKVDSVARDREQAETTAEAEWSTDRRHKAVVRLLLAKHVRHDTRLWEKDSSHSRVLQPLEAGQLAIVIKRRGKWTLVRVVASAEAPQVQGWMLNKHLR